MGLNQNQLFKIFGGGLCSNSNESTNMPIACESVNMMCTDICTNCTSRELCVDIEKFAKTSFFASGGVIIFLLLLTLALLLIILHMKIKMNKLRKCVLLIPEVAASSNEETHVPETPHDQGVDHDPSPSTAAPESVTMVDHSITSTKVDYSAATESNGKEALHLPMDTPEEVNPTLDVSPPPPPPPPTVTTNILQRSGRSDYDTVEDLLPRQLTLKSSNLHDYSSIEDIFSALPAETPQGGNLNVFIFTQDSVGGLKPPGDSAGKKTTAPKTKAIPVYSVVNKKRPRNNSEDEEPEFSLALGDESAPHDIEANDALKLLESAPVPPIPPRTYEMSEMGTSTMPDLGDGSLDEGKVGTSESTESNEAYRGRATPPGLDLDAQEMVGFTIHSTSHGRRNSYESVDLVFPDPGTAERVEKVT